MSGLAWDVWLSKEYHIPLTDLRRLTIKDLHMLKVYGRPKIVKETTTKIGKNKSIRRTRL